MVDTIVAVSTFTFAMAIVAALAVAALTRLLVGRRWPRLTAAVLIALGTVPPSVFGVLLYGLRADRYWAVRGPGVFGDIGGGPYFLAAITFTVAWTATCWGVAGWLSGDAPRWPRRSRIDAV